MRAGAIVGALLDGWPQAVLSGTDDTSLTKLPLGTAVGFWLVAVICTLPFSLVYTRQLRFHLRRFLESDDAPSGLGQNR